MEISCGSGVIDKRCGGNWDGSGSRSLEVGDLGASIKVEPGGALGAAYTVQGNVLQAVVALLLGHLGFGVAAHLIELDDQENTCRDDEEVDDGLDKVAPVPGDGAVCLGLGTSGVMLTRDSLVIAATEDDEVFLEILS